jgi:hypothetical protein
LLEKQLDAEGLWGETFGSMGLVFPLQPDLRKSRPSRLVLSSTTKRFTVGGSFLFIGLVLAAMYLAAAPLFKIMWSQGALFDQALAAFFYIILFVWPLVALLCWFYQAKVTLEFDSQEKNFHVSLEKRLGPFKWARAQHALPDLENLEIHNWKGAINKAAIEAQKKQKGDRYATRGHWILRAKDNPQFVLERRAKREDIEWIVAQINAFFAAPTTPQDPQNAQP